jgi:transcription elongation factor GreB
VPTYITATGAKSLAAELRNLAEVTRPKVVQEVADAAAQGDRSENAEYIYGKKRLREIDRRIRYLSKRLDDLHVVPDAHCPPETSKVYFGASVTVEDEDGVQKRYQLVGPDEARPETGRLSYQSPLGKVLMAKRVGDVVTFQRPAGTVELEVLAIEYPRT